MNIVSAQTFIPLLFRVKLLKMIKPANCQLMSKNTKSSVFGITTKRMVSKERTVFMQYMVTYNKVIEFFCDWPVTI